MTHVPAPRKTRAGKPRRSTFPTHIVGSPSALGRRPPPRERVLIAAEKVWSERGYAQASVEDVLKVADVSRATFYQHFESKEDVAAALFDRAISVLVSSVMERALLAKTFNEKLAAALDVYLELWQQHGRLAQELSIEALRPGSRLGPMRRRAVDGVVEVLRDTLCRERGVRVDPIVIEHLILGIEAVLVHLQIDESLTDATCRRVHDAILPLFVRQLGEPES